MLSSSAVKRFKGRQPISMLTCYDYPNALILSQTQIHLILVGDSLGEVIYGDKTTTQVTMEMMQRHVQAVKRGAPNKHVIADMPFATYDLPNQAVKHALTLKRAGADSVKMEIPSPQVIRSVVSAGIPVFGHVGLTPQTIHNYKKQGRDKKSAQRIQKQALEQAEAGCFGIVLEAIPDKLAMRITASLSVPTIGIASGPYCDGQVLVWHDLLGFFKKKRSYVKKEDDLFDVITKAVERYHNSVLQIHPESRIR